MENNQDINLKLSNKEQLTPNEEIVAVITAALSNLLGIKPGAFIIRDIKRNYELDSIWAYRGRLKLMR